MMPPPPPGDTRRRKGRRGAAGTGRVAWDRSKDRSFDDRGGRGRKGPHFLIPQDFLPPIIRPHPRLHHLSLRHPHQGRRLHRHLPTARRSTCSENMVATSQRARVY